MIPSSVTQINSDTFLASQSITDVYCNIDLSRYLTWTNNKYYNNNCFKQSKGTIFHVYDKEPWETSYSFINVTFVGDLENVSKLKGTVDAEETNVTLKVNMEDAASLNGELVIPTNYSDGVNSYQVTALGDKAFADCTGLTSVTIPSSVKAIGDKAFAGCTGLTTANIPASVTSIGSGILAGCSNISTVTVDAGNTTYESPEGSNAIVDKVSHTLIAACNATNMSNIPSSVTGIGASAFAGTSLSSFNIPSNITSLGNNAFEGCTELSSFNIPSSVTSIGTSILAGCTNIAILAVDANNTNYDSRDNCNAIIEKATNTLLAGCKSTVVPNTVTAIAQSAFAGCTGLTSAALPAALTSIGKEAFKGTGLTTVEIPYNVEAVGESSFEGCSGLVSVELPTNLAIIAKNTFLNCTNMTTVNIPVATTEIKDGAFKNCQKLLAVSLPSGLVELGMGAFEASGLESISLPPGVTAIAANTFKSCQSLVSATLYSPTVATVSDDSFSDNHQDLKIKVPSDLLDAYRGGTGNYSSKIYPITLDLNADPQKSTDKWCTYYNDLANVTVPSGTTIYKAQLDQVNNKVMLTEVEGSVVAKGNAVMLKSSDANIALSSATTSDLGTYSDNDLKGGDVTSGYIAYTLAGINGIMGFYRFTGNSLDPNKAHLEVPNSNPNNAPQLIPFDNETTGIMFNTVKANEEKSEWYSLDGRQIQGKPAQKGVYVKKGKKYVVK